MNEKPSGCNGCPYRSIGRGFVHGYGNISPKLTIVAQAPSVTEITTPPYRPLMGTSGKIVYRMLKNNSIEMDRDVYRTNILKCQPPGDILPAEPLLSQITEHCTKAYLQQELDIVRGPTLALGGVAMKHMTGEEKITTHRGYHLWSERYKRWIVPTLHPAAIFRTKTATSDTTPVGAIIPAIEADIRKTIKYPEPISIDANLSPSASDVDEIVDKALAAGLVSVDIETPGWEKDEADVFTAEGNMTMIGLCVEKHHAVVVQAEHFPRLHRLFHSNVKMLGHNYISDLIVLTKHFNFSIDPERIEDTMFMWFSLYSDLPKRLGVAGAITPYRYWKKLAATNMRLYNAYDVCGTMMIYHELVPEMDKWQTWIPYRDNINVFPFAQQMYELGCSIDTEKAMRQQLFWIKQDRAVRATLEKAFPMININAPRQLQDLFYKILKLPPQYKVEGYGKQQIKKLTADKEARIRLIKQTGNKIVSAVHFCRGAAKKIEFFDAAHSDGRIHSSLRLGGTATDRMEAKEPNVMQIPESARIIYIADKECDELC